MLESHLKIATRSLLKSKILTFINVLGLAVGICTFFLITQYVSFETSYDDLHLNRDRIYRVTYEQHDGDKLVAASARNFIGMPSLLQQLPEVEHATSFDRTAQQAHFLFSYEGKNFYQPGSFYQTDANFFNVFPSLLKEGDPTSVLSDPHNLVLSQKMAKLIFKNENPIGKRIENKSLSYSDVETFVVTGVMIDAPENAHFHVDFIAKNSHEEEVSVANYWTGPRFYTYFTLAQKTDPRQISDKLNALLKQVGDTHPKTKGVTASLQPIADIHNYSNLQEELESNGSGSLLYALAAIGISVMVAAWINYMNFTSSKLVTRAKEIEVRRIMGSGTAQLALQFFTEYVLKMSLAVGLAAVALLIFAPQLNQLIGIHLRQPEWSLVWTVALAILLAGSVIAGMYPVLFFIKNRQPVSVRLGVTKHHRSTPVRKALLTFQFACSISLMAMSIVVYSQLDFLMSTNKNVDIESVVSIRNPTVYTNEDSVSLFEFKEFQRQLTGSSLTKGVTSSSVVPGMAVDELLLNRIKRNPGDPYDPVPYKLLFIDYDFIPFYQLKIKAGRNYERSQGDEENWNVIIVNESAAHALGFTSAAEAKDQEVHFHLWGNKFEKYKIIGIVEDYHQEGMKTPVSPMILSLNHSYFQQVFYSVKLNVGTNPQDALAFIEMSWIKLFPDKPFDFFFQNEYFDRQFKSERRFGSIFGLFTGVSLLIACLGILGMTMFQTTSRLKELSIRKVLGASVASLVSLLSVGNFKTIAISSVCCFPVIYLFSSAWLHHYPLKISLNVWHFLVPVAVVTLIVAITSGIQTIKAALTNPVNHLKHE